MRSRSMNRAVRTTVVTTAIMTAALAPAVASAETGPAAAPPNDAAPAPATGPGWSSTRLAAGVELRTGVLGGTSDQRWTVTVRIPSTAGSPTDPDTPTTDLATEDRANALADSLRAHGFEPRVERVDWPDYADTPHGALGWRVRVGTYDTKDQASAAAAQIHAAGYTTVADWTGFDGGADTGPYRVRVAVIDPRQLDGDVTATYGAAESGRETTSRMATETGALVGVNGGFFVINPADGIPGTAAGVGVYHGKLEREASNGRAALVLGDGGRHAEVTALSTALSVHSGPFDRPVEGVNRVPGVIRDCGEPGDAPTAQPRQDVTCTKPDELVELTPELGAQPPAGPGVEAVVGPDHQVQALRPRGGPIPPNGVVLQGIGAGADWLTAHAQPGTPLRMDQQIRDGAGHEVPRTPDTAIVNGGPWLVKQGRVDIDAAADGIVHPGDPSFTYGWAVKRNPRTLAGIDAEGRILLATVDGRQPGYSEGFSLSDAARFMRSLGAVDAMNLDGGGSTAMAVRGSLITSPSDPTGERPVGDAVVVVPGRQDSNQP